MSSQGQPPRHYDMLEDVAPPARRIKLETPSTGHHVLTDAAAGSSSESSSSSHPRHRLHWSSSASRTLPHHHHHHYHHQFHQIHQHIHHLQQRVHRHQLHQPPPAPPPPPPPPPPPQLEPPLPPLFTAGPPYLGPEFFSQQPWVPQPPVHLQHLFAPYIQHPMPIPVIDLTGSSPPASAGPSRQPAPPRPTANLRPNRAVNEVIDVDALPDRPTPPAERTRLGDDIELIFTRPGPSRPPARGRFQGRPPPPPRPVEPPHAFLGFNPGPRFGPQEDPILGHGGRIGQDMGPNSVLYRQHLHIRRGFQSMAAGRRFSPQVAQPFRVPNMDYSAQTPGIIRRNTPPVDAAALRNADYKTPPPARHGFTRSPKEADVLVCAQCDQELGVETDTPQAGQVWAGKCGHCYCGICAARFRPATDQAAGTTKRSRNSRKQCVITGCHTNLAAKMGMFKIHL